MFSICDCHISVNQPTVIILYAWCKFLIWGISVYKNAWQTLLSREVRAHWFCLHHWQCVNSRDGIQNLIDELIVCLVKMLVSFTNHLQGVTTSICLERVHLTINTTQYLECIQYLILIHRPRRLEYIFYNCSQIYKGDGEPRQLVPAQEKLFNTKGRATYM